MQTNTRYFDQTSGTWKQLFKVDEVCHLFEELNPSTEVKNESFTTSFSVAQQAWVFFHDYFPNFYFHTREKLFSTWRNQIYRHNHTNYGLYYDDSNFGVALPTSIEEVETPGIAIGPQNPIDPLEPAIRVDQSLYPCFIDVVFKTDTDILLETVNWVSTVLDREADEHDIDDQWKTLTHITVWNSQQHTGRIALKKVFERLQYETNRKTQGVWSFNDFRNVVAEYGTQFLQDLFQDYSLDESMRGEKAWYEKELLQDKYMIVRFEFDNSNQKQLILHDTAIKAIKNIR